MTKLQEAARVRVNRALDQRAFTRQQFLRDHDQIGEGAFRAKPIRYDEN